MMLFGLEGLLSEKEFEKLLTNAYQADKYFNLGLNECLLAFSIKPSCGLAHDALDLVDVWSSEARLDFKLFIL